VGPRRDNGESPATGFQNPSRTVLRRTETRMDAEVWGSRLTLQVHSTFTRVKHLQTLPIHPPLPSSAPRRAPPLLENVQSSWPRLAPPATWYRFSKLLFYAERDRENLCVEQTSGHLLTTNGCGTDLTGKDTGSTRGDL